MEQVPVAVKSGNRFTQGSTWAGIGVLLTVIGNYFPQYAMFFHAATAAAAGIAGAVNN